MSPRTPSISRDLARARSSIRGEKSSPVTGPAPASLSASARSPVPQQASSPRAAWRTTASAAARRQRRSSPRVIVLFIASYTGEMRSNIVRTASGASLPVSTLISVLPPAAHELVFEPELVEAAADDEVDEVVHRLGAVVEAGREEEHDRAGLAPAPHVLQVDQRERRLARAEHELAALLQRDAGRPLDQIRHRPGGDRPERAHRARAD